MSNVVDLAKAAGLPDNYDPNKGLKEIAVAEAAEAHFARAKDPSELFQAIKAKLGAQREYVIWRDGVVVPSRKAGGPGRGKRGTGLRPVLPDADPGKDVIKRWRKKLKLPERFKVELEKAQQKALKTCEFDKSDTTRGTTGTGENEWYTPEQYIELARQVLGEIDLDPASNHAAQEFVSAKYYFTAEDDGLDREWFGRVWLNPPYAQPLIAQFVNKMVQEVAAKRVEAAIMLTHNYTDTEWFHNAANPCSAICFTRGRIKFWNPNGEEAAPTQGQAFFYFGNDFVAFTELFGQIGFVVYP